MFDLLSCLNHICHFVLAGLGLSNENSSLHSPDRSIKDSPLRSPLAALWPREVAGYHEEFIVDKFTLSVKEKGDLSFLKSCNSRGVYQKHSRISNKNLKYKDFWSTNFQCSQCFKKCVTVVLLHFFWPEMCKKGQNINLSLIRPTISGILPPPSPALTPASFRSL